MLSTLLTALVNKFSNYTWFQWIQIVFILILFIMMVEQMIFQYKKQHLPGPRWVVPFIGGIISMVLHPFNFWHDQMKYGGVSWNSIIGKLIIMVCDEEKARSIFQRVSEDMPLALHPNAYTLLGRDNITFLNGPTHRNLRHQLLPLFTAQALKMYVDIQVDCIRRYMKEWVALSQVSGDIELRPLIYDLNTYTSMTVFVGPYLNNELRKQLVNDYSDITNAMLGFPLCVPGTLLWKGYRARPRLLATLETIVVKSKERMRKGEEPKCLLDFWMINLVKEIDEAAKENKAQPEHSSDLEVAKVVVDFLFASQDASTSSITFATHLLGTHPEVLAKVRAELNEAQSKQVDPSKPLQLSADLLPNLRYTWQVTKELLRFRPPATIVPHIANKPVELDGYTVPSGALIVPSIWSSNRSGFTEPEKFDPERFSVERAEDKKYEKQFLTFGTGPHSCLGQRYATNHIMCFIALLCHEHNFVRKQTKNMEEIIYLPTIYPADGCVYSSFTDRK